MIKKIRFKPKQYLSQEDINIINQVESKNKNMIDRIIDVDIDKNLKRKRSTHYLYNALK
jgi:hypothetical protein